MVSPIHLRLLAPGNNWSRVGAHVSLGLTGYYSRLGEGSTVSVVSGDTGPLATDSPRLVATGEYDMGLLTPVWYGAMAGEGTGFFDHPLPLRALAVFPHDDRLVMAVREETGITSLRQLVESKPALKISMPPPEWRHPATIVIEEVLRAYGASVALLEEWGGEVLHDRPRTQSFAYGVAVEPIDPRFDAVFDEAVMSLRWQQIHDRYALRILPIDEDVLASLESRGFRRNVIRAGHWPQLDEDIPTIDFSGWLLFCRADLPDEVAYQTIAAIDEQRTAIHSIFPLAGSPLTSEVEIVEMCKNTGLPLHPGAARYYDERAAALAGTPADG